MTHLIDKHIDERIERYKDYRRKSSSREGMSNLQRYIKGEYHKDNESIFISIKKGWLQDTALGKEKSSDTNSQRNQSTT